MFDGIVERIAVQHSSRSSVIAGSTLSCSRYLPGEYVRTKDV
jgi:hypothetical protein